jgi:hypothetical protein
MANTEGARGSIVLKEKPRTDLVDLPAYALPEDSTDGDFFGAAAWVTQRGGQVKCCDSEGLLVVSTYPDGGRYHEWVGDDSLLIHDTETNEFTVYGHSMADHYVIASGLDHWNGASQ